MREVACLFHLGVPKPSQTGRRPGVAREEKGKYDSCQKMKETIILRRHKWSFASHNHQKITAFEVIAKCFHITMERADFESDKYGNSSLKKAIWRHWKIRPFSLKLGVVSGQSRKQLGSAKANPAIQPARRRRIGQWASDPCHLDQSEAASQSGRIKPEDKACQPSEANSEPR